MNSSIKKIIIYILIIAFTILYIFFGMKVMRKEHIKIPQDHLNVTVHEEKVSEKNVNQIYENARKDESVQGLGAKVTMPFIYINSKPIKPSGNYVKKSLDEMIINSVEYVYYVPSNYDSTYIEGFDGIEDRCRISVNISELSEQEKGFSTIDEYVNNVVETLSNDNPNY